MKFAIGHVRVSSNKQYEHGDSIQDQMERIEVAAKRNGFTIIRWFEEHYSGRKNQRLVTDQMLEYLAENRGDVDAVFINQINRFTRAGGDNYLYLRKRLFDLGVELIDAFGVIQENRNTLAHLGFSYDWSIRAPSRMAEVIMAEQAHAEATDILTRTVGQSIRLEQAGYQVRAANIGYRNAKIVGEDGKRRPVLEPHESEAVWIRTMFTLRAEGELTDKEICERVNAMGFRTRKIVKRDPISRRIIGHGGQQKLTPKRMDNYLQNLIYCGIRKGKWTYDEAVRTPFPGLVSIETFNQANRGKIHVSECKDGSILIETNLRNYRRGHGKSDFLLRHGALCPECGQPFMGSYSRNKRGEKFGYYHCDRGHKRFSVAKEVFESQLGYLIEGLALKPSFLSVLKLAVLTVWREKNAQARVEISAATDHAETMRSRQSLLIRKLEQVSSPIVIGRIEQEIEALEQEVAQAERHQQRYEISEDQIMRYFDLAESVLEHPLRYLGSQPSKEKIAKLWGLAFERYPTWSEIESGTPQRSLAYRLKRYEDGGISELVGQAGKFWNTLKSDIKRVLD